MMNTILIGLAITAMIMGVSVTIAQCMVWYEKKIASWHYEMMQEEFAKGWDSAMAAIEMANLIPKLQGK
jgi:6,7-dimethyl-8-ribityllumazine synthase